MTDSICITDEILIYHTKNNCGYGSGDEEICEGICVYDFCEGSINKELLCDDKGSVVASYDSESVVLRNGTKLFFNQIKEKALTNIS